MSKSVRITSVGIKQVLDNYDRNRSLAEYIWNGFDANATKVELEFDSNAIGNLSSITIRDNGYGIDHSKLEEKFRRFHDSEKFAEKTFNQSQLHGRTGVGRLTFFKFANEASWETVYKKAGKRHKYRIKADSKRLDLFNPTTPKITTEKPGTEVILSSIFDFTRTQIEQELQPFLVREFGWFLELNKSKAFKILINGEELDYTALIGDRKETEFTHEESNTKFHISYVRWKESLNKEWSQYYYIDSKDKEKWKEFTTLNRKGDDFYHSVYIKSSFFDNFGFGKEKKNQSTLIGVDRSSPEFKFLQKELSGYLRKLRKPFLKTNADNLVKEYESEKVFPELESEFDQIRKEHLQVLVKDLYKLEPKIFSTLNIEQKKTFVGLLNLLIDTNETENLLKIIEEIVDLDRSERRELAELLQSTNMSRMVATTRMLERRNKDLQALKKLVFDDNVRAKEVPHVQTIVASSYWIFGERFHLVTEAEPVFEEALRRYLYLLRDEKKNVKIDHPDKRKQMDIFLCRQLKENDEIHNIVVELKKPTVRLGAKELDQVKKYMGVILEQSEFNAPNMKWEFYLVGNKFDTSGYIKREQKSAKVHGKKSLIQSVDNYEIYVKTWSEIFTEVNLRLDFVLKQLEFQKKKISKEATAEDLVEQVTSV